MIHSRIDRSQVKIVKKREEEDNIFYWLERMLLLVGKNASIGWKECRGTHLRNCFNTSSPGLLRLRSAQALASLILSGLVSLNFVSPTEKG